LQDIGTYLLASLALFVQTVHGYSDTWKGSALEAKCEAMNSR